MMIDDSKVSFQLYCRIKKEEDAPNTPSSMKIIQLVISHFGETASISLQPSSNSNAKHIPVRRRIAWWLNPFHTFPHG